MNVRTTCTRGSGDTFRSGSRARSAASVLLAVSRRRLLWYVVFPLIDPCGRDDQLPRDQSQITGDLTPGADIVDVDEQVVGPDGHILNTHDIPYDTEG